LDVFVELARGALFVAIAVAFLVLAWMFLRLARIFSTTEETIKEVSEQVVPLLGKTHVTVDNINSQLSQLDSAVGDVADITGELDQTTAVITRGVRGGVIKVSSATAGLSRGISAFFGSEGRTRAQAVEDHTVAHQGRTVAEQAMDPEDATVPPDKEERF
jgi:uncharacterized protein YoxC